MTSSQVLLAALASRYGLSEDSFLFPSEALVLRTAGRVYWFSDQVETYTHPAQMAEYWSVAYHQGGGGGLGPRSKMDRIGPVRTHRPFTRGRQAQTRGERVVLIQCVSDPPSASSMW